MAKRPKRRLLIDIRIPNEKGLRVTIRGDDLTVKSEALDAWVPVCERIVEIASEHFGRSGKAAARAAQPEGPADAT